MTIAEVTSTGGLGAFSRIEQIRSTLHQLSGTGATAATTASAGAAFATAMSEAASASPVGAATRAAGADGVTGADVVATAKGYLGVPYVFGGEDASGMDCSGLVQRVYADLGISLPRVVPDQADVGTEVASLADAQPGDLIVSKDEGHILIYAGDGKVIHAPRPGAHVELVDNWRTDADISTIRRIVPSADAGTVATAGASAAAPAGSGAQSEALASLLGTSTDDATLRMLLLARMSLFSGLGSTGSGGLGSLL